MGIDRSRTPQAIIEVKSSRRHGGDHRGSSYARRARKLWMLGAIRDRSLGWAPFGGDGARVKCVHGCGTVLTFETVEADRIQPGGPYVRSNVQPACRDCNLARSDNPNWQLAA